MKKVRNRISIAILILGLFLVFSFPTHAAIYRITNDEVTVRSAAGSTSPSTIVFTIPKGATVTLIGKSTKYTDWFYIEYEGKQGFAEMRFFDKSTSGEDSAVNTDGDTEETEDNTEGTSNKYSLTGKLGSNVTYSIDSNNVMTISGSGRTYDYSSNTRPFDRTIIEKVIVEGDVTYIGNNLFYHCDNLKTVIMNDNIVAIGQNAFEYCENLSSITLSKKLQKIKERSFYCCYKLKNIKFEEGLLSIGGDAFDNCDELTSIYLPASLKSITSTSKYVTTEGYDTFGGLNMKSIDVDPQNKYYASVDGVLFNKKMTKIIRYPAAHKGKSYSVPAGIKEVGENAFSSCKYLTHITVPSGVIKIGVRAFSSKSLTRIDLPLSLKAIEYGALPDRIKDVYYEGSLIDLISINIDLNDGGNTNETLWEGYTNVHYGKTEHTHTWGKWSVTQEPTCSEHGYKVRTCTVCKETRTVAIDTLPHTFGDWKTEKKATASSSGLKSRTCKVCGEKETHIIPKLSVNPGDVVEHKKSNGQYKILQDGKTVAIVKPLDKSVSIFSIPARIKISGKTYKVVEISDKAFLGCSKIEKIEVGKFIKKIGIRAFKNCAALKEIVFTGKQLESVGKNALYGISKDATISVPKSKEEEYKKLLKKKGQGSGVTIKGV